MSYYIATFLAGAHRFGVPFPKLKTFSEIFWPLHIDYFIYEVTTTKVNFHFNCAVKLQHVLFENETFLQKMLALLSSSNIPLHIGKNLVEKLCEVL